MKGLFMKIIETLANGKLSAKKKLKAVTDLVADVRGTYGNEDVKIESIKVNSVNGFVSIGLLTADEKAAVAEQAIRTVISMATAVTESTEGAIFDRSFEAFIATDALLTNLDEKSESSY